MDTQDPLPSLRAGEIHIWQINLAHPTSARHTLLSEDEQQRARQYHSEAHHRAFVTTRSTLRLLLGHYLHTPPYSVRFGYNPHGKPRLESSDTPCYFNISHSGQWSMLAFSRENPVGIDLEKIRPDAPQKRLDIARRFFSPREWEPLQRLPSHRINAAFFACWTRKEAYIKCHGQGLALSLAHFSVSIDPEVSASLLETSWLPDDINQCQLSDLPAPEGYCAALAYASQQPIPIRHFLWPAQHLNPHPGTTPRVCNKNCSAAFKA